MVMERAHTNITGPKYTKPLKEKSFSDGWKREEKAENVVINLRKKWMQALFSFSEQNSMPSVISNILASLNSFQPPLTVGMITTSTSKNMDMISRVAEKGIGVNSSGKYGAT